MNYIVMYELYSNAKGSGIFSYEENHKFQEHFYKQGIWISSSISM